MKKKTKLKSGKTEKFDTIPFRRLSYIDQISNGNSGYNKSEEILTREQKFKIYSLLDDVIKYASKAKQECLKENADINIICDYAWEGLDGIIEELSHTIIGHNTMMG